MGLNHALDGLTAGFGPALIALWPFWAIIGAGLLLQLAWAWYKGRRLGRAGMPEIDRMTGTEFEQRLAVLFRALGYSVMHTGQIGDWGADLVISKNGTRTVVQAKRYNKNVGVPAVQQATAAKAKYGCTAAMVVTNSRFTTAARELARVNAVELWDRDQLIARLLETRPAAERSLAAPAQLVQAPTPTVANLVTPAIQQPPACPRCGAPMVLRTARRGENVGGQFYGCSTYPQCRGMVSLPPA
jgi:restriction system protein